MAAGFASKVVATVKVLGLKEVGAALEAVPLNIKKDAERVAVQKVLDMIAAKARAEAPKGDRLGSRYKKKYRKANLALSQKINAAKWKPQRFTAGGSVYFNAPHAHLVEYGHRIRTTDRGPSPLKWTGGRVEPNPFIRRAFDAVQDPALAAFVDSVNSSIGRWYGET